MTDGVSTTIEEVRREYNAAVANGLGMKARRIGRRLDALEAQERPNRRFIADGVSTTTTARNEAAERFREVWCDMPEMQDDLDTALDRQTRLTVERIRAKVMTPGASVMRVLDELAPATPTEPKR